MGERLGTKASAGSSNNRHSVCFGVGYRTTTDTENVDIHRRSLSPQSNIVEIPKLKDQNKCDNESTKIQSWAKHFNNSDINTNVELKHVVSPTSPDKNRRNSKSSIPVYVRKSPLVSSTLESPIHKKSRQSVDNINPYETPKSNKSDQNFRSRRSTFPRNSFSSLTSNSSTTSTTNNSHCEDKYSRAYFDSFSSKSPSHKRRQSHARPRAEGKPPHTSLDNVEDIHHCNNNSLNSLDYPSMRTVPASPSTKSRIPVLRSSSCRSVPHSSQAAINAKNSIPKNITFGHGIGRTFKTSHSNIKTGQHWYQMLDKSSNENTFRRYSVEKYAEQNAMDTNSVIEKCNFEDMRMALN